MQLPADELREKTERGAKLLDVHVPGWWRHVKLRRLDMSEPTMCMLGQLFGTRTELAVAKEMFPELWQSDASGYSRGRAWLAKKLGFSSEYAANKLNEEFRALDIACSGVDTKCFWADEVAKRLAATESDTSDSGAPSNTTMS